MSAQPAYSQYPERSFERAPRERIDVVVGRGSRTQAPTLSPGIVFLAKMAAVVLVAVALVASATLSATMQANELSQQIGDARSQGAQLEVSQSALSNPTTVKQRAGKLGMAAPESSGVIELEEDVVATDDSGALSLSQSVENASGSKA